MRLLILGGTTEASALARRIAGRPELDPVLSLAGRTRSPMAPPIPFRVGGFGGVAGLRTYLSERRTQAVIDATHPFAAQMSRHVAVACRDLGLPLAAFTRPAWTQQQGDRWTRVPHLPAAVAALGQPPRRVFLTIGGVQLVEFAAAPQHHYIVRAIDRPDAIGALPSHRLILARGPFGVAGEIELMRETDVLVTKNSGGQATAAKLQAARELGIEVVIVERPAPETVPTFYTEADVLLWLEGHRPAP
jgi:precorrin-6A/cobalt-precorrin-6A reductase